MQNNSNNQTDMLSRRVATNMSNIIGGLNLEIAQLQQEKDQMASQIQDLQTKLNMLEKNKGGETNGNTRPSAGNRQTGK